MCATNSTGQNNGTLRGYLELHGGPGYPAFLNLSQTSTYDNLNRLALVSDSGRYSRSFGSDAYGNLSVTSASGIAASSLTLYSGDGSNPFFGNNQLKSGQYDGAGNQTVLGSLQIGYDAENRRVSVQDGPYAPYTYFYDGNGNRVTKSIPNVGRTVYVYDAFGLLAAEYAEAGETSRCRTCYVATDHLGSTRLVTDESGQVVGRHDYLPFGEEVSANTAGRDGSFAAGDGVDNKFTGQTRDAETGEDYFNARMFGSVLGRFTSPDPGNAGADLYNPQSWNAYAYVLNNPLNRIDPSGLDSIPDPCGTNQNCVTVDGGTLGPIDPINLFPLYAPNCYNGSNPNCYSQTQSSGGGSNSASPAKPSSVSSAPSKGRQPNKITCGTFSQVAGLWGAI